VLDLDAWLLEVLDSLEAVETETEFVIVVVLVTDGAATTIVTVALAPAARSPRDAVTVPADPEQFPVDAVHDANETPGGNTSLRVVFGATEFPRFCTVAV